MKVLCTNLMVIQMGERDLWGDIKKTNQQKLIINGLVCEGEK